MNPHHVGLIVLFSGGADSTLLMELAYKYVGYSNVLPVMFRYGQKHSKEIEYAKKILNDRYGKNPSNFVEIDLSEIFGMYSSPLLKGGGPIRDGVHEMHVPARNSIFVSIALGIAETKEYDEIWIGCDYSDLVNRFPDCTQNWISKMSEAIEIAGSRKITLRAPLLGMTKELVTALLPKDVKVFSGYEEPKKEGEDGTGT